LGVAAADDTAVLAAGLVFTPLAVQDGLAGDH
jgi:hypothetical protein